MTIDYQWTPPEAFDGCECDCHKAGAMIMHCVPCCFPGCRERKPVFEGVEFKTIPGARFENAGAEYFADRMRAEAIEFGKAMGLDMELSANFSGPFRYPVKP